MRFPTTLRPRSLFTLALVAALAFIGGCAEEQEPVSFEEALADLPRQELRYELPDGRILTGTGIRLNDEHLLIGGDVLIPISQSSPSAPDKNPAQRANIVSSLWPTRVIPYQFDAVVSGATRAAVIDAMGPWRSLGFIFRERTTQSVFVRITGAYFPQYPWVCGVEGVGYTGNGSTFYAGPDCRRRDFVHEWGHILGMHHEHARADRDSFIIVDPSLDEPIGRGNASGPYDFGSIMHYDAYARDANGNIIPNQILITPRDGRPLNSFGWNETPSGQDGAWMASLYAGRAPGVPLYQLYSEEVNDWFYTTSTSQRDLAMTVGYTFHGVVARVEPNPQGDVSPFWRFYKGPPETDHFYTTSATERDFVLSYGWHYEGIEGYLFNSQVDGTAALHRFNLWIPSTGDQVHYYTTNWSLYSILTEAGYGYDGVAGYVYPP